jgi:hypothetical protein
MVEDVGWIFKMLIPRGSGGFAVFVHGGERNHDVDFLKDPIGRIGVCVCISREKISFVRKWRLKKLPSSALMGGMHAPMENHGGRRLCTDGFVEVIPLPPSLTHR